MVHVGKWFSRIIQSRVKEQKLPHPKADLKHLLAGTKEKLSMDMPMDKVSFSTQVVNLKVIDTKDRWLRISLMVKASTPSRKERTRSLMKDSLRKEA